jgi:glycerophosphoryl diester phosphodiesterase
MKLLLYSISFFALVTCFSSCERDAPLYEVHNLNGDQISAFGHGGMGVQFKYPIDCYESIEPCLRIGADGTEMDVQMTSDSVLVGYHHSDLHEGTMCSGMINDHTASELWGCHFASPFSSTLQIRTIGEIFSNTPSRNDYTFTFDCKSYNHESDQDAFRNRFANAIINLADAYSISAEKLYIESPDSSFLRVLKNKRSDLKLFIYPASFEEGLNIAEKMDLFGITISTTIVTKEQIERAHEKGIRITLFNTRTKDENLDAILKSPDFIQSDDIIYLLKVFGKYKK